MIWEFGTIVVLGLSNMMKKKATESSAFAASGGSAAAQPAKAASLKPKTSVAPAAEGQLESSNRTAKSKTPPAKSTAVTHRHKKPEIPELELRVENSPAPLAAAPALVRKTVVEPANEDIAKLAYSYYVARGYQDGNQADDWFRASAELRAKLNP